MFFLYYVHVGAVYVCTEDAFPNKRLSQLAELFSKKHCGLGYTARHLSDGIFVEHAATIVSMQLVIGVICKSVCTGILLTDSFFLCMLFSVISQCSARVQAPLTASSAISQVGRYRLSCCFVSCGVHRRAGSSEGATAESVWCTAEEPER